MFIRQRRKSTMANYYNKIRMQTERIIIIITIIIVVVSHIIIYLYTAETRRF